MVATACSGMPSGGPVRVIRRVPAEDVEPLEAVEPVERIITRPGPNDTPAEIVFGYLSAQAQPADRFATARSRLAPGVDWKPEARALVFSRRAAEPPVVRDDRATVRMTFTTTGAVSAAGEWRARSGREVVTFRLRLIPDAGWRLEDPPSGLLLREDDVPTALQRAVLYWPDQARRLVPAQVFLPASDRPVAAVAFAMLEGPRGWLAPAVRTSIPRGTELIDAVDVVGGEVTLNFSREIRRVPQETLSTLVAQVVWTLTERPEVETVRVLAEGEPLAVPGRAALREHRRSDWVDQAPIPPTDDRRLFFVRNGAAHALDEAGRISLMVRTPPLSSFSVNRAGTVLAGVTRPSGGRQSLILVDLAGADGTRTVLRARALTQPSWEPGGDVVWTVQTTAEGTSVVAVSARDGDTTPVALPRGLPSPLRSLRLSPNGARAAVVAGPGRTASLWVARVERGASGGLALAGPVRIVPALRDVTAVAFDGALHLLVASRAGARPALHRVDLDGYGLAAQRDGGLPDGPVTALTVSAGDPADRVASSATRLWRRTPGADWAALQYRGSAATFAG